MYVALKKKQLLMVSFFICMVTTVDFCMSLMQCFYAQTFACTMSLRITNAIFVDLVIGSNSSLMAAELVQRSQPQEASRVPDAGLQPGQQ